MTIRLEELLAKVPPEIEKQVKDTRDGARALIQSALREECKLVMRTPDESRRGKGGAQVPIEVVPGYPECLQGLEFPDDYWRIVLLSSFRAELERCLHGDTGLLRLEEVLLEVIEPDRHTEIVGRLQMNAAWIQARLKEIDEADPVRQIVGIDEDVLGVYRYEIDPGQTDDHEPNRASIELYWCVIGLVAKGISCTVEDLTVVVLAHELAHAYTQVGADITGRRWLASSFRRADVELKEGLAQYLCERVLAQVNHRYRGAPAAFDRLLAKQSFPYHVHRCWLGANTPEAVRAAMLEVRRNRLGGLNQFAERMNRASTELG
jgi:hypothetical protein